MTVISPQDAAHVLHFFRSDEGHSGGSFTDSLIALVAAGDIDHQQKLHNEYPSIVAAFWMVMNSRSGLDTLRSLAGSKVPA